jgi:hypothetical protein
MPEPWVASVLWPTNSIVSWREDYTPKASTPLSTNWSVSSLCRERGGTDTNDSFL